MRRLALFALVLAAGCPSSSRELPAPRTDGPSPILDAPRETAADDARGGIEAGGCVDAIPTAPPAPSACPVSCPRLEPVGAVVELTAPYVGAESNARVTFAGGRWYVAWEGGQSPGTLIQRLTADGEVAGPALAIAGTTPLALLSVPGGQELILYGGRIAPASGPAGRVASIHRLDLDLRVIGTPLLERGPSTRALGFTTEATAAGELVATWILDRPGGLVRELRYAPGQTAAGEVPKRDWRPGPAAAMYTLDRIGGQRVYPDVGEGWLRLRPLLADGTIGAETRLAPVTAGLEPNVLFVRRVGDRVWVGGSRHAVTQNVLHLRAVDAATGVPVGQPLALNWAGDGPYRAVDAHGTLLLMAFASRDGTTLPALIPIDPVAGVACPASIVSLPGLGPRTTTYVTQMHFEGDTAGVALDTFRGADQRRLFFTRLRCAP